MIATIVLIAVLFAAQIAAYFLIRRALHKRATYKRRVATLVAPHHIVAPWARNRPGDN